MTNGHENDTALEARLRSLEKKVDRLIVLQEQQDKEPRLSRDAAALLVGEYIRASKLIDEQDLHRAIELLRSERNTELGRLWPAVRLMLWVGGAFGISIIALIWSLITGQATLVIP